VSAPGGGALPGGEIPQFYRAVGPSQNAAGHVTKNVEGPLYEIPAEGRIGADFNCGMSRAKKMPAGVANSRRQHQSAAVPREPGDEAAVVAKVIGFPRLTVPEPYSAVIASRGHEFRIR